MFKRFIKKFPHQILTILLFFLTSQAQASLCFDWTITFLKPSQFSSKQLADNLSAAFELRPDRALIQVVGAPVTEPMRVSKLRKLLLKGIDGVNPRNDQDLLNVFIAQNTDKINQLTHALGFKDPKEFFTIYLHQNPKNLSLDELMGYFGPDSFKSMDEILIKWNQKLSKLNTDHSDLIDYITRWNPFKSNAGHAIERKDLFARSLTWHPYSLREVNIYAEQILDASFVLNLSPKDFLVRLQKNKYSTIRKFMDEVEVHRRAKLDLDEPSKLFQKVASAIDKLSEEVGTITIDQARRAGFEYGEFLSYIRQFPEELQLEKAQVYLDGLTVEQKATLFKQMQTPLLERMRPGNVLNAIRQRTVSTPDLFAAIGFALVADNVTMLYHHFIKHGADLMMELGSNIFAFSILEVIVSLKSAKQAAHLVANPELALKAHRMVSKSKLTPAEIGQIRFHAKKMKELILSAPSNALDVGRTAARNAPSMFVEGFGLSFLPFVVGAVANDAIKGVDQVLMRSTFDAAILASFYAVSTNIRYSFLIGKVFPYLGNELLANHPNIRKGLVFAMILANINIGSWMFVEWHSIAYDKRDQLEDLGFPAEYLPPPLSHVKNDPDIGHDWDDINQY